MIPASQEAMAVAALRSLMSIDLASNFATHASVRTIVSDLEARFAVDAEVDSANAFLALIDIRQGSDSATVYANKVYSLISRITSARLKLPDGAIALIAARGARQVDSQRLAALKANTASRASYAQVLQDIAATEGEAKTQDFAAFTTSSTSSHRPRKCKFCGEWHEGPWKDHACSKGGAADKKKGKPENTSSSTYVSLDFILDSGATSNLVPTETSSSTIGRVMTASGDVLNVVDMDDLVFVVGDVRFSTRVKRVNGLRERLLSVAQLCREGWTVAFADSCAVLKKSGVSMRAELVNGLYVLSLSIACDNVFSARETVAPDVLHARFAHMGHEFVSRGIKSGLFPDLRVRARNVCKHAVSSGCRVCVLSKAQQLPHRGSTTATELMDAVHFDICDIGDTVAGGYKYFLIAVEGASKYVVVRLLRSKGQAVQAAKEIVMWFINQSGRRLRRVHSDRGSEFMSSDFQSFCRTNGVQPPDPVPYSPSSNGLAERHIRTVMTMARSMMVHAGLPASFSGYAIQAAVYTWNLIAPVEIGGAVACPHVHLLRKGVGVLHLRSFGCSVVYARRDHERHANKTMARGEEGFFVGYGVHPGQYHVYDPKTGVVSLRRDLVFDEQRFMGADGMAHVLPPVFDASPDLASDQLVHSSSSLSSPPAAAAPAAAAPAAAAAPIADGASGAPRAPVSVDAGGGAVSDDDGVVDIDVSVAPVASAVAPFVSVAPAAAPVAVVAVGAAAASVAGVPLAAPSSSSSSPSSTDLGRSPSGRSRRLKGKAQASVADNDLEFLKVVVPGQDDEEDLDMDVAMMVECDRAFTVKPAVPLRVDEIKVPRFLKEALDSPQADLWMAAMEEEVQDMRERGTFGEPQQLPYGHRAMGCKWVYTVKGAEDGTIHAFKARLVVRGDQDDTDYDFADIFAPTPSLATLRTVIALAVALDWETAQADVSRAFLNGRLDVDEELYMRQPSGFQDPRFPGHVVRLFGSLYGLKRAPQIWHREIVNFFVGDLGMRQGKVDPCIFVRSVRGRPVAIVVCYVDDVVIFAESVEERDAIKDALLKKWVTKDKGEIGCILGLEVRRNRRARTAFVSQAGYVREAMKELDMVHVRQRSTPMELGKCVQLDAPVEEGDLVDQGKYLQAIGKLLYLQRGTRPDLSFVCSRLAKFSRRPGKVHWKAVVQVFQYLEATVECGVVLGTGVFDEFGRVIVRCFTDADYASESRESRSVSGTVLCLGDTTVAWQSNLQRLPSLSTFEAEYVSLARGVKDAVGLSTMISDIGFAVCHPPDVLCDNSAAVAYAATTIYKPAARHLRLSLHFVRLYAQSGVVSIKYVPGNRMPADVMTKPLSRMLHWDAMAALGMSDLKSWQRVVT